MSVPDDPFNSVPRTREESPSSSSLLINGNRPRTASGSTPGGLQSIHRGAGGGYGLTVPPLAAIAPGQGLAPQGQGQGLAGHGSRTPRRVQWINQNHVVDVGRADQNEQPMLGQSQPPQPRSTRATVEDDDERTLNASGLAHLTTELERHQSLSKEERNRPRFVVGGEDDEEGEEIELTAGEEDYDYRLDTTDHPTDRPTRRSLGSSVWSSGASSVQTEEDDTPGDRAGSMGDLEKTLSHVDPEDEKIDVRTAGGGVHPSAALPPPQALIPEDPFRIENDIRDEMPVFVDPGETDGLPSLPPGHENLQQGSAAYDEAEMTNAQASALVKAHKSGRFGNFLRNRKTGFAKGFDGVSSGVAGVGKGAAGLAGGVGKGAVGVATGVGKGAYGVATGVAGTVTGRNKPVEANPSLGGMGMGMGMKPGMGAGALAGGGVLASLLALYDNGQNGQSGQSTPASSRPPSLMPSESDESEDEREKERKWRKKRDKEERQRKEKEERHRREKEAKDARRAKKDSGEYYRKGFMEGLPKVRTPLGGPHQQRRKHAISDPPAPEGDLAGTGERSELLVPNAPFAKESKSRSHGSLERLARSESPKLFASVKRAADKLGLDMDDYERPKAARNGGGVFGALIQNTGSLTGVATPAASSVVPDAKRPGYRLSRFSLNDARESRTESPRPTSLYSRSETPHSATRVGTADDSPTSQTQMVDGSHPLVRPATTDNRPRPPMSLDLGARKSGKPFSIKSFTDLTHLPLTPGAHFKNFMGGNRSQPGTPPSEYGGEKQPDYFGERHIKRETEDDRRRKEWEAEKKKRRKAKEKKKQQEIFIIQHVAAILARQQFLMKLIRAFMMFGSPTHRLEAQIQATARVLELNCQVVSLPGLCLISFNDDATHTSETKFLKQAGGLDLQKLLATHHLYWEVVHDKLSAEEASKQLDILMTSKPYYNIYEQMLIGGMCSSFICCVAFYGSFIDALISFPLGMLLVAIQIVAARNDLYSNVFEIVIATIQSFLAAALASSNYFCYTAVTSSAIVLILPGYIVLSGSLELASRNITSGSVRMGYSVIYSLFLGFGIAIGAEIFRRITGKEIANDGRDWSCAITHSAGSPWYLQTVPEWWYFLIVPGYSFWLSLRQSQPLWAKELPAMVLISCAGWSANHFSARAFPNRADITSAIGSFVVGLLGNIWGRFYRGTSFVVMLVGVLFQLPSGLGNGGLFNFAAESADGSSSSYSTGFQVAQQLVQVAIGLTVGLFLSAIVVHPFGGGRRRGGSGIFSF